MTGLTTKNKAVISGGTYKENNITLSHYWKYEGNPLTICIAAIASEGEEECIILATDHMVTIDIGESRERVLGKLVLLQI